MFGGADRSEQPVRAGRSLTALDRGADGLHGAVREATGGRWQRWDTSAAAKERVEAQVHRPRNPVAPLSQVVYSPAPGREKAGFGEPAAACLSSNEMN